MTAARFPQFEIYPQYIHSLSTAIRCLSTPYPHFINKLIHSCAYPNANPNRSWSHPMHANTHALPKPRKKPSLSDDSKLNASITCLTLSTPGAITGRAAENLVIWYLKQRGWTCLHRNYAAKSGEVDIIAERMDDDIKGVSTVAFIEVKATKQRHGLPPEINVTRAKQKKILSIVKLYIGRHAREAHVYRCDIAAVTFHDGHPPSIRYIPNAFCAKEEFGW